MRPVPPLVTQRNVTEQSTTTVPVGTPVVLQTRPVQQVTQIRIQPQPAGNSLQRRGLALTVSPFCLKNPFWVLLCCFLFYFRGSKCWKRKTCLEQQIKLHDQRKR